MSVDHAFTLSPTNTVLIAVTLLIATSLASAAVPPAQIFFEACHSGDLDAIKSQLTEYPKLVGATNRDGEHCIHIACIDGNFDIVQVLLEHGCGPDLRALPKKRMLITPLGWAAMLGRSNIIQLLLNYGADVNLDFGLELDGERKRATALDAARIILGELELGDTKRDVVVHPGSALDVALRKHRDESGGEERMNDAIDVLENGGAKTYAESMQEEEL